MSIPTQLIRVITIAAAMLAAVSPAAFGQNTSPRQLSDQRWQDRAYGLSLRPPVGTRSVSQTADDYLLRIADEGGEFTMSVAVKRSRSVLTLEEVAETAREQVFQAQGTSEILEERGGEELADRPAAVLYARMPQSQGSDILLGQAIVQLDPRTFAVLEVRCDIDGADAIRTTFEAMLESFEATDPQELDRERQDALERGRKWREGLTLDQLHDALIEEQTFRLVQDGEDIGYMRVRQEQTSSELKEGVEVEVQTRVVSGGMNVDSIATFFLADDDSTETWSIKTTQRPASTQPARSSTVPDSNSTTFIETGIRTGKQIDIITESPYGHNRERFERPGIGYLSQVEAWLLPQLLPIEQPTTYGFYCYNARARSITFRTEEIVPTLDGFTLHSRLTPNDSPIEAVYTAERRLSEKQLSPNRKQLPASPERIRQVWRNR